MAKKQVNCQIRNDLKKIIYRDFRHAVSYEYALDEIRKYIEEIVSDLRHANDFSGNGTYKLDSFGNSIITKYRYKYVPNSIASAVKEFESTIVYHIDYDIQEGTKRVPIKEYVAMNISMSGEMAYSNQISYLRAVVMVLLKIAKAFQSTLYEDIEDNIKFTETWVSDNIENLIYGRGSNSRVDKLFSIISQSKEYSAAILITAYSAVVYSLPTSTLSNSETHIEEILVLDSLREQLGLEDTVKEGVTRVVQKDEIEFGWDTTKPSIKEVYE